MSRTRLRWVALIVAIAAVGGLVAGIAAVPRSPRPYPTATVENANRLKMGMTEPEVEAILGGPAHRVAETGVEFPPVENGTRKEWFGPTAIVRVLVNDDGKVHGWGLDRPPQEPNLLTILRRRLGL
jgi:hypothetical protein